MIERSNPLTNSTQLGDLTPLQCTDKAILLQQYEGTNNYDNVQNAMNSIHGQYLFHNDTKYRFENIAATFNDKIMSPYWDIYMDETILANKAYHEYFRIIDATLIRQARRTDRRPLYTTYTFTLGDEQTFSPDLSARTSWFTYANYTIYVGEGTRREAYSFAALNRSAFFTAIGNIGINITPNVLCKKITKSHAYDFEQNIAYHLSPTLPLQNIHKLKQPSFIDTTRFQSVLIGAMYGKMYRRIKKMREDQAEPAYVQILRGYDNDI